MIRLTTPPEPAVPSYPPMPPVGDGAALPSDVAWQRLNRRMLLVAPLQELMRGFIPGVVILFTGFGDPVRTAITGAGALALVGYGVVRYLTTTYRITPEQIQIRRGVVNRSTMVAPRDRVRSVDVTSPFLHRLLGLGRVVVGTGRIDTRRNKDLVLDGLVAAEAERLRVDLLRRPAGPEPTSGASEQVAGSGAAAERFADPEVVLVRLRPRWLLYAPFTVSGAITGLVIVGFASRLFNEARIDPTRFALTRDAIRSLQRTPLWLDVVQVAVVVVVVVSLLSIVGYELAFHGFRLTRRGDGTLHVARGLFTRRETTLEHKRVRGVELVEPLLLRAVGGARLVAVAVGLRAHRGNERTASLLVPPSPRRIDLAVGADIVDDPTALEGTLVRHGAVATRRRYTRAVLPALAMVAVLVVLVLSGVVPAWAAAVSPLLLVIAALLAADRARSLGHRVGGRLVVTRHGSFVRRRSVVAADGVIGAVIRASPFQRRAGVATLHLTTAAGRQSYPFADLPTERVWDLVREVLPTVASTTAPAESCGSSWEQRKAAARRLGAALPDAPAFERLVELLADGDTGVGEQAAFELLRHGGRPGLAAVARAYATLDETTIGYFLAGAAQDLWLDDGYPLPAELAALRADEDPAVARGAAELAEYLQAT